jgi:hypothetical protein
MTECEAFEQINSERAPNFTVPFEIHHSARSRRILHLAQVMLKVYNDFTGKFQTILCSWIYRSYARRSLFSNLSLSAPAGS